MTKEDAIENAITAVMMSPLLTREEKLDTTIVLADILCEWEESEQ